MKSIEDVLNSDDRLPGKTQCIYEKAQAYKEACELLDKLKAKHILNYKADDPTQPLCIHAISIKFNFKDEYCHEFNAKEMAEIIGKVDTLLVDGEPISSDWQLSSTLYVIRD